MAPGTKPRTYEEGSPASVALEDDGRTLSDIVRSRLEVYRGGVWVRWDGDPAGGGGGGGGAVTIADGDDAAQGSTGDLDTANTVIGRLKKMVSQTADVSTQTTLGAMSSNLGIPTDAEALGNGSLIAITKRLRTRLDEIKAAVDLLTKPTDSQLIYGKSLVVGPTTYNSPTTGDIIPSTDTGLGGYRWVSLQVTGTYTGSMTLEVSNNNADWLPTSLIVPVGSINATSYLSVVTGVGLWAGPLNGRYFRVRVSALSAGSVTALVFFSAIPSEKSNVNTQSQGNLAKDVDASSQNPLGIGGRGSDAVPTPVSADGRNVPAWYSRVGEAFVKAQDGAFPSTGTTTEAEAAGNGSLIAITKRLRTLLNGGLPAALGGAGGLKAEIVAAVPAGTNNIGDVDVLTLPALPAGTNNIGDVDVLTLPALVAGTAYAGKVRQTDGALDLTLLNSAPASDTGQVAVPVREISKTAVINKYELYQAPRVLAAAATDLFDIFNAAGSGKTIRVWGIYAILDTRAATAFVVGWRFGVVKTSAVGTGGTAHTYKNAVLPVADGVVIIGPKKTAAAALPAQVTARSLPAGGATALYQVLELPITPEESAGVDKVLAGINQIPNPNLGDQSQAIELAEGEGLKIRQMTATISTGAAFGWLLEFDLV